MELMKVKDQSLGVEGLKEHRIITVFGDVRVKRKLYQDTNGDYRFLLDKKMGWDKGRHLKSRGKRTSYFHLQSLPFPEV